MATHVRALNLLGLLTLVLSFFAPMAGAATATFTLMQDEGQVGGVADEAGQERPERFPAAVDVDGTQFLFDSVVPVDRGELVEVATQGDLVVYARDAEPPYDRVFVSAPARRNALARYQAATPGDAAVGAAASEPCPAEAEALGDVQTGDGIYAFAGAETDRTTEGLTEFAVTQDGWSVFAGDDAQPPSELLVGGPDDLLRFVLLDDEGRPLVAADDVRFGEQSFSFEGVADAVDPSTLARAGCLGGFPVLAPPNEVGDLTQAYVRVGERLFAYQPREGEPVEAATPDNSDAPAPAGDVAIDRAPASPALTAPTEPGEATANLAGEGDETPAAEPIESAGSTDAGEPATPNELITGDGAGEEANGGTEVVVDEQRFFLDRRVPVDLDALVQVTDEAGASVFAPTDQPPLARVYAADAGNTELPLRYLAEIPIGEDGAPSANAPCTADLGTLAPFSVGEARYAYAGPEPDLTTDQLGVVLTTTDGAPVYAEVTEQPFPELFFEAEGVLNRFVLTDAENVPQNLGRSWDWGGQRFAFSADVTGAVDLAALVPVGCVGPYPLRANQGEAAGAFSQVFVVLNDQTPWVLAFAGAPQAVPTEPVASPDTAESTGSEAVVATAEPTPPPIVPAQTPEPTTPASEPTAAPATATAVPATAIPSPTATPEPTTAPEPTATQVPPTATPVSPTVAPPTATFFPATVAPTDASTAVATAAPTDDATASPSPAGTPPPAADADVVPEVVALPTVAPPVAPVSGVPVDAAAPIPPLFPREIEVQGIRYLFDLEVAVVPTTLVQVDVVQAPETTLNIFAAAGDEGATARLGYRLQAVSGPFVRIYAIAAASNIVARYLPEAPVSAAGEIVIDRPCSAEASNQTVGVTFDGQAYRYTYASVEANLSVEELRQTTIAAVGNIPTTDDGRDLLLLGGDSPFAEAFVVSGDELQRFVALNEVGFPVTLNNLVFAETRFVYEAEVSVEVATASLPRIGCAGPFPLFAPAPEASAAQPLTVAVTIVDNRVYQFNATAIVRAPRGQAPIPTAIVPPPAGVVQIALQAAVAAGPTPTPLPNARVVTVQPQPGVTPTPTPATGVVAQLPVRPQACLGDSGPVGSDGLPENLPNRIQFSGVAYRFAQAEAPAADVEFVRLGCVGPFEAVRPVGAGAGQAVFLRSEVAAQTLYRFEAARSFAVEFVVTGNPQVITAADQTYVLSEAWQRSVYSSVTNIVYAQDPSSVDPAQIFAVKVDDDLIAEYVPEGGDLVEPPAELSQQAESLGINRDLTLAGGRRYLLVGIWLPIGTTTNGWVTLYSSAGEGLADVLLATDPRSLELFVYRG